MVPPGHPRQQGGPPSPAPGANLVSGNFTDTSGLSDAYQESSKWTHSFCAACLSNDASLNLTVGIVSKTNHCQDRTTASPLSLCNRPPRGDKQPGWKRCFCKLNSVGPKDCHYVNYIPKISHLSPGCRSGSRVDAFVCVCECTGPAGRSAPLPPPQQGARRLARLRCQGFVSDPWV